VDGRELFGLLAVAAGVGVLVLRLARRQRRAELPADYAAALRLLARRGSVRRAQQTANDFAAAVSVSHPGAAARAFERLTQAYLAQRFGGRACADSPQELRALRAALRSRSQV
jgi:hypothetical protein